MSHTWAKTGCRERLSHCQAAIGLICISGVLLTLTNLLGNFCCHLPLPNVWWNTDVSLTLSWFSGCFHLLRVKHYLNQSWRQSCPSGTGAPVSCYTLLFLGEISLGLVKKYPWQQFSCSHCNLFFQDDAVQAAMLSVVPITKEKELCHIGILAILTSRPGSGSSETHFKAERGQFSSHFSHRNSQLPQRLDIAAETQQVRKTGNPCPRVYSQHLQNAQCLLWPLAWGHSMRNILHQPAFLSQSGPLQHPTEIRSSGKEIKTRCEEEKL